MKRKKKIKPKPKRLSTIILKISRGGRTVIERKARKFANGNMSAWIRHAAWNYVPKDGEDLDLRLY